MKKLFVTLVACVGLFGCVEAVNVPTASAEVVDTVVVEVYAPSLPPLARVEVIPVAPSRHHVWCRGYWHWSNAWVWVPGRYVARVPGHVWVGPRYFWRGHRVVYVRGYWRR